MADLTAARRKVLDVGWTCQPNGYLKNEVIVGMDLLNGHCPENYTSCVVGDVMRLPNPFEEESFDGIVAGEIIEHLEYPLEFLRNCRRTLINGGQLVLSTPNPNYPIEQLLTVNLSRKYFYTAEHICLYPQRWLIRMMEIAGFNNVKLYSGGIAVPFVGYLPFPRIWCYEYIAIGTKA